MFSWFKKKPSSEMLKHDPIEFHMANSRRRIDGKRVAIPRNYAENNYEYVARNSGGALHEILIKHALQLRGNRGVEFAMQELEAAPEFLDYIEDAIVKADANGLILPPDKEGKHESNFIYVSNLFYAYPMIFLIQDWTRADRLAKTLKLPVMRESIEHEEDSDGGPYCHLTKMFAALTLNDQSEFKHQQKRYQQVKSESYFWGKYFNYDEMMGLILARDNAALDAYLPQQEQSYLNRKNDKKLKQWDMIFGCVEDNDFVYDIWATSLCNLARHIGMEVNYSSEVIPTHIFRH